MTSTIEKNSGKGTSDGVVSELAAFFGVKPGHEEQLRAALDRFVEVLRTSDPAETIRTGLRDSRHVIFDEGRQLLWATTFETEWDPYLEDALLVVGAPHFFDWMQHTTEADVIVQWLEESGGIDALDKDHPDFETNARRASAGLKKIIQSRQTPAAVYFNPLGAVTMTQIIKGQLLDQAFQQVLDNPAAEEALSHPALKPLLDLASS
ncbi:hypothetical protein HJ588_14950 [Flexivirga sp. ID2601S]|uniref:Uncharacterized protein n=1 Tax=Flexivirga aerilata TaxID=1656889 RepID=A0A849AI97_9MICO|nr:MULTISPECIES: hypothetical protein [Flexivirga]NNG40564.1 hypothetical protein [Flexivirga aerilata]